MTDKRGSDRAGVVLMNTIKKHKNDNHILKIYYFCKDMRNFAFIRPDRVNWLQDICMLRLKKNEYAYGLNLSFGDFPAHSIKPEHIASLACLIEEFYRSGIHVTLNRNSAVGEILWSKYRIRQYWAGGQNYAETEDDRILNLQRIVDEEKELYGKRVSEFLKARYFQKKDMTPVDSSITEALYNISDHADAGGNAFSMVMYDDERAELHVAVCDFGKGTARTVKDYLKGDISDGEALLKAMEDRFTIGSSSHNGGLGLGNILSSCTEKDYMWIVSNGAILVANAGNKRIIEMTPEFKGTLVFYSMSLSHFEEEETINDFTW